MNLIPLIDYKKIAHAQDYYQSLGYQELSVPWTIGYEAYNAMRPPSRKEFFSLDGYLNASGEQGFLELMLSGHHLTKHCCVTPCFRDEPVIDGIHHRYFLKLELINTDASEENLHAMLADAKKFFERYTPVAIIPTNSSGTAFDIIDSEHHIELGSYGIRHYKNFSWIYGTGVALPRLDTVIHLNK